MRRNNIILLFFSLFSLSIYSQKTNEYKFLVKGEYDSKIYEKLESNAGDKVYLWHKIEETKENDPGIEFIEFYVQINCSAKTSILKSSITHWRDGAIQKFDDPSNKEIPITDPKSIPGISYKNHCKK
ncbi:hypothetical protein SAMN05421594_4742 [Chryseobacterium oleae]|uniref:Uncharacterized protein n=1 Tax=Chryseobacterium oleae TaxID=491207 RepID=A0A1I5D016_CHROL|nr:hypothetical protein [Chryseobacterium oleae]SFN92554.1 hypothetical protein SAMN05421594_4742 [Chryseobacterium oleae]